MVVYFFLNKLRLFIFKCNVLFSVWLGENKLKNLHVTVENIPNTNYNENAKFCAKNIIDKVLVPYHPLIMKCSNRSAGRYLLIHLKGNPDTEHLMHIVNIYVYGQNSTLNEITGKYFQFLIINAIINDQTRWMNNVFLVNRNSL